MLHVKETGVKIVLLIVEYARQWEEVATILVLA